MITEFQVIKINSDNFVEHNRCVIGCVKEGVLDRQTLRHMKCVHFGDLKFDISLSFA